MKNVIGFFGGLIFAVGLVISGMTNPTKVIGFLDIFGSWDYALAFVMGGAVLVNLITFKIILRRKPLYNKSYELPSSNNNVTLSLLFGSVLFGVGWGLVGICPGPSIVNLVTLNPNAYLFVGAMIMGMLIHKLIKKKL